MAVDPDHWEEVPVDLVQHVVEEGPCPSHRLLATRKNGLRCADRERGSACHAQDLVGRMDCQAQ
eukprot:7348065-Lingulodinium_polyedra.AAC.1